MTFIDDLMTADRIVIAGLEVYDRATSNALAGLERTLTEGGFEPAEIEAALEKHRVRIRQGRDNMHAEAWTKALCLVLSDRAAKATEEAEADGGA